MSLLTSPQLLGEVALTDNNEPLTEVPKVWPSVGEVAPLEEGGPNARKGFNYQDEIAVSFLIAMLEDQSLLRVQCETHDDLVLIWEATGEFSEQAEYVQVKGGEQAKYWSVADLCTKKSKTTPSVFEASLARDRHAEPGKFRIVTLRPVNDELFPLTYLCASEARELAKEKIAKLHAILDGKFPQARSPKGNDCKYWINHCTWDVRNDVTAARNDNLRRLLLLGNATGALLIGEQLELLLEELRSWAKAAGDAKWVPDRARKIISQAQLRDWWKTRLADIVKARGSSAGGQLATKMKAAGLPDELISLAIDLRRGYAAEVRAPRYMQSDRAEQLQVRVKSEAMSLRASLIAGDLHLSGPAFHATCVKRMDELSAAAAGDDVSAFLKGCLYDIADRCLLRFEQPLS